MLLGRDRKNINNWIDKTKDKEDFDSFKLYILECDNKEERFFKIGRTSKSIENRFKGNISIPYPTKVIRVAEGSAEAIYKLEKELIEINLRYKYFPNKSFSGDRECFSKIEL
ncbi:MAG: hypothetical protein KC414_07890 [Romboutsia sp.]|nr:hypothetical protein [Romboutsia sp.]